MAIPTTNIDLYTDVYNTFGTNTAPATASLVDMHNIIFGSGTKSLTSFGGTGRPENYSTQSATNVDENSATLNCNVGNTNNLTTSVYFQYDTDSNFGSPATTSTVTSTTDSEVVSVTAGSLSSDTTYYFRAVLYNNYNSHSSDRSVDVLNEQSFTTDILCNAPTGASWAGPFFGDTFQISWTDASPAPANNYDVEYEKNGSGNWFQFASNVTSGVTFEGCTVGNTGDTFRFRVRSDCGQLTHSGYSTTSTTPSISGC